MDTTHKIVARTLGNRGESTIKHTEALLVAVSVVTCGQLQSGNIKWKITGIKKKKKKHVLNRALCTVSWCSLGLPCSILVRRDWLSAPSGSPGCRCFPLLVTQYPPQVSDWWYLSACAQIILVLLHSVPKAQESWHWQLGYSTSKLQMGSSKWKVESCPVPGRGLTYYNVLHKCPVLLLVTITLSLCLIYKLNWTMGVLV